MGDCFVRRLKKVGKPAGRQASKRAVGTDERLQELGCARAMMVQEDGS